MPSVLRPRDRDAIRAECRAAGPFPFPKADDVPGPELLPGNCAQHTTSSMAPLSGETEDRMKRVLRR